MRTLLSLILLLLTACSATGQAGFGPQTPETGPDGAVQTSPPVEDLGPTSGALLATWAEGEKPFVIRLVDPATGQDMVGFEPIALPSMHIPAYNLSPDGESLAVIESYGDACEAYAGGEACRGNAHVLHLLDLPGGREVTAPLTEQGWVELLAFDPVGQHLALVKHGIFASTLMLFDVRTGQALAQRKLDFRPSHLYYTQDGGSLALYGQSAGVSPGLKEPDPPRVALVDAGNLEVLWEQELAGLVSGMWCLENCSQPHGTPLFVDWSPAVVASPDGKLLYIVHADQERLDTVDFDSRVVYSTHIQPETSLVNRFLGFTVRVAKAKGFSSGVAKDAAISGDGKRLYVVTQTTTPIRAEDGAVETVNSQLDIQLLDLPGGQRLDRQEIAVDGTWIAVSDVTLTPDGAYLVLNGWNDGNRWAQVFEVERLKPVVHLQGWELVISRQVSGQSLILGSRWGKGGRLAELGWLDPRSFEFVSTWKAGHDFAAWLGR